MAVVNVVLGRVFDVLLLPFRALPPIVGLVAVSLVVAVGMLLVYKRTSDQRRIAETKSRIHAGIFEIRLFSDDPIAIFRAQFDILRHNAAYFALSLVPLAWMIVPLVLTLAQLQFRFGYEGFAAGDVATVRARLAEGWRADLAAVPAGGRPPIALEAPDAIRTLTPAVWLPSRNEVVWKVRVAADGDHTLTVKLGERSWTKSLRAEGGVLRRSPVRHAGAFLDQVLWPAEPPLGKGPLAALEVDYPEPEPILGMPRWLVIFFVLSIVFAFALRGRMGVQI
jgi:uncharacterized membrane protein (DUF106 family)